MEPLYGTRRTPGRLTLGPAVTEVAVRLGKPLMPHQRRIVDVALEIDPATGRLAYSEVIVIGPRQATGKTELILPVMAHRCLGFPQAGPQSVLYTAQTADAAKLKWRDVHLPRLLGAPKIRQHLANPKDRYGGARMSKQSEAIMWANGSRWSPGATTGKTAGTGDTLDLAVIDEAWSHADGRTELGLRPATMTRHWKQFWIMSMIPGITRCLPGSWKYLEGKRATGRARCDADVRQGVAFFDFSAPPGSDPDDPKTWFMAMPGLGRTVMLETVQEDHDAMDPIDFQAEYLGWAPGATVRRWQVITRKTWDGLRDFDSHPLAPVAIAVEMNEDRSSAWVGIAGRRVDGDWHIEVVEPGQNIPHETVGVEWVLPRVKAMASLHKACTIVIDPRRPANSLIVPLQNAGFDVTTPNQNDIAGACGRFYDSTGQEVSEVDTGVRVRHLGQPEVDQALSGVRKLDVGAGAFTFVKKGSTSDLGALYCCILAMHGHVVKAIPVAPRAKVW